MQRENQMIEDMRTRINVETRQKIRQTARRMIFVTFQKEGIHCYPAAATDPNLIGVEFLNWQHRHIFHFKVAIEVFHNDRELEFILVKRWLESLYSDKILELNHMSCEMISDGLYEVIATRYPNRYIEITVSEDGENGCTISYNKL